MIIFVRYLRTGWVLDKALGMHIHVLPLLGINFIWWLLRDTSIFSIATYNPRSRLAIRMLVTKSQSELLSRDGELTESRSKISRCPSRATVILWATDRSSLTRQECDDLRMNWERCSNNCTASLKVRRTSFSLNSPSTPSVQCGNLVNPFNPKSDQFKISSAASPKISHHTVWRTWLLITYSLEIWLHYQLSLHHSVIH